VTAAHLRERQQVTSPSKETTGYESFGITCGGICAPSKERSVISSRHNFTQRFPAYDEIDTQLDKYPGFVCQELPAAARPRHRRALQQALVHSHPRQLAPEGRIPAPQSRANLMPTPFRD